jgi:fucose 4-O-acetylase-like acetyltransferase
MNDSIISQSIRKPKVASIIFLQSFGATLVVYSHSIYITPIPSPLYWIGQWIAGFYMPLFFFIAGYLFLYTNKNISKINTMRFICNKIRRIILPYIMLTSIAYIPKVLLSKYAFKPVYFNLTYYFNGLLFPDTNPIVYFWFLPTIFLIYIVALVLYRVLSFSSSLYSLLPIPFLFFLNQFNPLKSITLFNINSVLPNLIFFWLGSLFVYYQNNLSSLLSNRLALPITFLITILLTYIYHDGKGSFIRAVLGILLSLSLANWYIRNKFSFFNIIDGYYYQIYLLSWFFITFCRIFFYHKIGLGIFLTDGAMFISGLFLPVVLSKFINKKLNFLKFAIGM